MTGKKSRLLLAVTHTAFDKLEPVLGSDFDLCHAVTMQDALLKMRQNRPDIVLSTLLFDESRMFDFLNLLIEDPSFSSIPFVACRALPSRLTDEAIDSMRIAAVGQGAASYIDFIELASRGKELEMARILSDCLKKK